MGLEVPLPGKEHTAASPKLGRDIGRVLASFSSIVEVICSLLCLLALLWAMSKGGSGEACLGKVTIGRVRIGAADQENLKETVASI